MRGIGVAGLVCLVVLVGCSPGFSEVVESSPSSPSPPPMRDYAIRIEAGLDVAWNGDDAATRTLAQIKGNERLVGRVLAEPKILSVEAWAGGDVPAQFAEGNTMSGWPVVWIVRAQGTFVAFSCPEAPCPNASSGWYLFDDSGQVIGSGFPLAQTGI